MLLHLSNNDCLFRNLQNGKNTEDLVLRLISSLSILDAGENSREKRGGGTHDGLLWQNVKALTWATEQQNITRLAPKEDLMMEGDYRR